MVKDVSGAGSAARCFARCPSCSPALPLVSEIGRHWPPLVNGVIHRRLNAVDNEVVTVGAAVGTLDVRGDDLRIGRPDQVKLLERSECVAN
jgi:hypothetical protein